MIVKTTEVMYGCYDMMDEMFKPQNILRYSIEEGLEKSRFQLLKVQSEILDQVSQ